MRASSGWTFRPRSYNCIPNDSPIFWYIEKNKVEAVQELFSRKEASPFDCDEHGRQLLSVSVL